MWRSVRISHQKSVLFIACAQHGDARSGSLQRLLQYGLHPLEESLLLLGILMGLRRNGSVGVLSLVAPAADLKRRGKGGLFAIGTTDGDSVGCKIFVLLQPRDSGRAHASTFCHEAAGSFRLYLEHILHPLDL